VQAVAEIPEQAKSLDQKFREHEENIGGPAWSAKTEGGKAEELTEEVSTFINKMASSFEKVVKKYVQAKRNLKTAEE
jgi:hypothetical protein